MRLTELDLINSEIIGATFSTYYADFFWSKIVSSLSVTSC